MNNFVYSIALYPFIFALAIIELLIIRFIVELIQPNNLPNIVNLSLYTIILFSLIIYGIAKNWNRWVIISVVFFTINIERYILNHLIEFFKEGNLINIIKNIFVFSMKYADLSSLSAIATLITSFLILLTLYEYKAQRKSSYLPKLILESSSNLNVWLKKIKNTQNIFFPINWTKNIYSSSEIDMHTPAHSISDGLSYKITCHNIGNGSAHSIKIFWNFNIKKMIRAINIKKDFGFEAKLFKFKKTIDIKRPDEVVETQQTYT